jgi:predicted GTPase
MDDVARLLRKVTKPVLLAVNTDNAMREKDAIEFYKGLGSTILLLVYLEVEQVIY